MEVLIPFAEQLVSFATVLTSLLAALVVYQTKK